MTRRSRLGTACGPAEQLGLLQKEDPAAAVRRELLALDPAAVQAEYDAYVASVELPQLLAGGDAATRSH